MELVFKCFDVCCVINVTVCIHCMLLKLAESCQNMLVFLVIVIVYSLCEICCIRRFTENTENNLLSLPHASSRVVLMSRDNFTF